MLILFIAYLAAGSQAVAPIWYPYGRCGISKYKDAGEDPSPNDYKWKRGENGAKNDIAVNLPQLVGIVGGDETRRYEFPWMVMIIKTLGDRLTLCGGSIISNRWILTAAHCVESSNVDDYEVIVGEHDRYEKTSTSRQRLKVSALFVHEDYKIFDVQSAQYDIALLKLRTDINFDENVQPICAPDPEDLYVHRRCIVAGWGRTVYHELPDPRALRYAILSVTTNEFCQQSYNSVKITDDMLCVTDNDGNRKSGCMGDSGGPVMVKNADGSFAVAGIISFGLKTCSRNPGVNCRVGYFAHWVTVKINNNQ